MTRAREAALIAAERALEAARAAGLRDADLAEKLGVRRQALTAIRSGKVVNRGTGRLTLAAIERIARFQAGAGA